MNDTNEATKMEDTMMDRNDSDTLKKKGWGWMGTVWGVLGIVLLIAGILWIFAYLGADFRPLAAGGDADDWKAVFLTNGQVYFGQVANEQADPLVLENIYYLQVQRQLQPAPPPAEGQPAQQPQEQQQLTLVKFGNELHGPQDQMRIVRDQVLYIESLKESGRVVEAINRYLEGQQQGQ